MKEVLRNCGGMYILFEDGGAYVLSVMVGGIAMYEMRVRLNATEVAGYRDEGEEFVGTLADQIARDPGKYEARAVR
ncbi:hypothetical protein [Lacipirellula parvula]|uniref:Uncharacterized protein n=1 Tax=Lacipirellula parvula TaxID=2650471 RepID=A0A5K7XGF3_9BACT|nr:hypothetical protein [Lacipirellula parvula]BBO33991.1 hypothetical protein PLANPX_3603 [Lacipirellula parvula]